MNIIYALFVALLLGLVLLFIVKKKKKVSTNTSPSQVLQDESVLVMELEKEHFRTIVKCSNCGSVTPRYVKKGTLVDMLECSKCGGKKLSPVELDKASPQFFNYIGTLDVEVPSGFSIASEPRRVIKNKSRMWN